MRHVNVADLIVAGEYLVFLLALLTFVIGYTVSSHGAWARSPEGRHLVTFRSSLVLFGVLGIVNNLAAPDYPGRDALRVTVVGASAATAVWGVVIMARAQLARRRAVRTAAQAPRTERDTSAPRY